MQTILDILKKAGGWYPGLYLKIDNAPTWSLSSRRWTSPAQWDFPPSPSRTTANRTATSCATRDVLELGMAGGAHLDPWYWRNDFVAVEQWSRNIVRDHYVHLVQLHEQHNALPRRGTATCACRLCRGFYGQVHSWLVRSLGAEQPACFRSVPFNPQPLERSTPSWKRRSSTPPNTAT